LALLAALTSRQVDPLVVDLFGNTVRAMATF
jgi:hypothetical protein